MTSGDLTKHAAIKILSVVLALTLWLTVAGGREGELTMNVPVEPSNVPRGFALSSMECDSIAVTLTGPKILLLKLRGERIIMPLDMTGLREGRALFTGFERRLHLPREVSVTRVFPVSVEVVLARSTGTINP
jgi:hypothetical protein